MNIYFASSSSWETLYFQVLPISHDLKELVMSVPISGWQTKKTKKEAFSHKL